MPAGAYVAVQPQTKELGKAVDSEKGFQGPVFVNLHNGRGQDTLRVTLTGAALDDPDADTPQLNAKQPQPGVSPQAGAGPDPPPGVLSGQTGR